MARPELIARITALNIEARALYADIVADLMPQADALIVSGIATSVDEIAGAVSDDSWIVQTPLFRSFVIFAAPDRLLGFDRGTADHAAQLVYGSLVTQMLDKVPA